MNRRGFLGSLVALVCAPKPESTWFAKDLVGLRIEPVAIPMAQSWKQAEFIGYHAAIPLQFADGVALTVDKYLDRMDGSKAKQR